MSIDYLTLAKTVRAAGCDAPAELEELCRQILVDRPTGGTWPPSGGGGSNLDGSGDPTGVATPDYVGQYYRDTVTGNIWKSTGATSADWVLTVQDLLIEWQPANNDLHSEFVFSVDSGNYTGTHLTFNQPELLGFSLAFCADMTSISFPFLKHIDSNDGDSFTNNVSNCNLLNTLSAPLLEDVSGGLSILSNAILNNITLSSLTNLRYGSLHISYCIGLTHLTLGLINHIGDNIVMQGNSQLIYIDLSGLVSIDLVSGTTTTEIEITNCPALSQIDLSSYVPNNGTDGIYSGLALTLVAVNSILSRYVANPSYVSGTIDVSGGTTSAPTQGAGSAHDILVARGVTIIHN